MKKGVGKWIVIAVVCLVVIVSAWFFLRPKSLPIIQAVPVGAMTYVRSEHLLEHINSLKNSKFVSDLNKVNVPGFLEHQGYGPQKIEEYKALRKNIKAFITSPLFKQFFSREIAVALYPALDGFSNGQWPVNFSGLLVVVRPESGAKITQMLANAWNQYSKEWVMSSKKYSNITMTSITMKNSGITVFYARLKDLLVLSVDERILKRAIDTVKSRQGNFQEDVHYKALAGRFYDPTDGEIILDMPNVIKYLKGYWKEMIREREETSEHVDRDVKQLEEGLNELFSGFDGMTASGGTWMSDKPLRMKWFVQFDPAKSSVSFQRLNNCVSLNNPTVKMIPKDVMIYQWSSCLEFTQLYEDFKSKWQQSANTSEPIENPLSGLEKAWGLTVSDDILPVLGRGFAWFMQGVDTGGIFPIPKFGIIFKVKDQLATDEILHKIATTPLTLIQNEEYHKVIVNYVTVPLMNVLRPSYAFVDGFLIIATTDKLVKQSIDASQDPLKSLSEDAFFKQGSSARLASDQMISYMKTQDVAKQSKTLIDWADQWFDRKIQQASADEQKAQQKIQSLSASVEEMKETLVSSLQRLDTLRKEKGSLQAQVQASALAVESKNTLSQQGPIQETGVPEELRPERLLELKKSQVSALELEINGLQRDVERAKAQLPELLDDQSDLAAQKQDALNYRYYIDEVVVPVLKVMESLISQRVTTQIKDGVIDSEMLLIAQ